MAPSSAYGHNTSLNQHVQRSPRRQIIMSILEHVETHKAGVNPDSRPRESEGIERVILIHRRVDIDMARDVR